MFICIRDIINMLINISTSEVIMNSIICDQRENTIIPNVPHERYTLYIKQFPKVTFLRASNKIMNKLFIITSSMKEIVADVVLFAPHIESSRSTKFAHKLLCIQLVLKY